jgi:hypothetical protein
MPVAHNLPLDLASGNDLPTPGSERRRVSRTRRGPILTLRLHAYG